MYWVQFGAIFVAAAIFGLILDQIINRISDFGMDRYTKGQTKRN